MILAAEIERLFSSFRRRDLDPLPWPIIIINENGKIIYKNKFAGRMKIFRLRTNSSKLISASLRDSYLAALRTRRSEIFECNIELGVSHAITLTADNGESAVFFVVCSMLLREMDDICKLDSSFKTFSTNVRVINTYRRMCEKLHVNSHPEALVLLKNNEFRFSRAVRHFEMYANIISKTHTSEKLQLYDTMEICKGIISHFGSKIAPLGYRINVEFAAMFPVTLIQKRTFVCIFLELLSLSLRISEDHNVSICISENTQEISYEARFKCGSANAAKAVYSADLGFIGDICRYSGWSFTDITPIDDENAVLSFGVPVKSPKTTIGIADFTFTDDIITLLEEEFSVLYFHRR